MYGICVHKDLIKITSANTKILQFGHILHTWKQI